MLNEKLELPAEMTPAMRFALGMPNFRCGPIAHLLRSSGMNIPRKAEEEQAVVIFWCLQLAIKHGDAWPEYVEAELKRRHPSKGK